MTGREEAESEPRGHGDAAGPRRSAAELIVSAEEAYLDEQRISEHSPLAIAIAITGARDGDIVTVHAPSGDYPAELLSKVRC